MSIGRNVVVGQRWEGSTRRLPRAGVMWLLALTPIILLLTHYAAVFPHEFSHSFVAWILGIKHNPLNLDWGGSSLLNILLLIHIDENVAYTAALHAGKDGQVALVAFAGPGLANGGLFLLSRWLIKTPWIRRRPLAANVLFWFLFMNLANLYDYVPLRVFAVDGDVRHFILATGWSPWIIYVIGSYLVLWAVVDFYRVVLPHSLSVCGFDTPVARGLVLIVATGLLFGYFAIPGLQESDKVSLFMARTSLLAIPVVILLLWQRVVMTGSPLQTTQSPSEHVAAAPNRV